MIGEQILIIVLAALIGIIIGTMWGQHSVWKYLRKKGHVTIDEWYYTAVNVNKGEVTRYWD